MKFAWLCSHESYQPEELVEQAVAAEAAGFDMVLASDHFHPWVDDTSAAGFAWSWLGAAAARTGRVELGTAVTCPLFHYHPAMVAQAAATVDRLSGGRFTLGLGTGEAINEAPMGYAFPGYGERMARMGEALEIIRRLLDGEKLDFEGEYYVARTAKLYSPPARRVPVLLAAGGPKSAQFAGEHADGLITSVKDPAQALEKSIEPYRQARAAAAVAGAAGGGGAARGAAGGAGAPGDGPGTVLATRWTVLADGPDEAWRALSSMRGLRAPGRLEVADPAILRERADAMDRAEILGQYAVAGDLDELADHYRPLLHDIGADYISVQVASVDPMDTIAAIGEQVLPKLRAELAGAATR
jgi:coenzyme F420-dependent glucose-6-phosphate dehydrogenase